MHVLNEIDVLITDFINNVGIFAPIISSILIVLEAIVPFLPLALFVTFNFYYFGHFLGFLISWIMTCIGGYIIFKFWRYKVKDWLDGKVKPKEKSKVANLRDKLNALSLEKLVLLITLPFAPAFLINMVAGLSNIPEKRFITALIIGKVFMVYFWGFVGTSLIDSFSNPYYLIRIVILMIVAFAISRLVKYTCGIE